ncbi:unnamed protein product [Pleuronectes platessa]|uniref:Uncharacterized protein n=1 Tax=Pleuronectes platessa TaxID=8262 RepID=A0A9N7VCN0_PLEPL|nr:unnamed protein product [Pleuronectes platessa]
MLEPVQTEDALAACVRTRHVLASPPVRLLLTSFVTTIAHNDCGCMYACVRQQRRAGERVDEAEQTPGFLGDMLDPWELESRGEAGTQGEGVGVGAGTPRETR